MSVLVLDGRLELSTGHHICMYNKQVDAIDVFLTTLVAQERTSCHTLMTVPRYVIIVGGMSEILGVFVRSFQTGPRDKSGQSVIIKVRFLVVTDICWIGIEVYHNRIGAF